MSIVLRDDDARRRGLEESGWRVVQRSWAARLDADRADRGRLRELVARMSSVGEEWLTYERRTG